MPLFASRGSSQSTKDVTLFYHWRKLGCVYFLFILLRPRYEETQSPKVVPKPPLKSKCAWIRNTHWFNYILCVAAGSRPLGDFFLPRNLTPAWTVCLPICRKPLANKQPVQLLRQCLGECVGVRGGRQEDGCCHCRVRGDEPDVAVVNQTIWEAPLQSRSWS